MNKYFLYISIITSSLLALTACSNDDATDIPVEQKTAVSLNVGMSGGAIASRAITTLPEESKLSTLPTGTTLFMVMKSEAADKTTKYSLTKGVTGEADNKKSPVTFSDAGMIRYWDDAYARDAKLSVFGVCTPGGTPNAPTIGGSNSYTHTGTPTSGAWSTTANTLKITGWTVSAAQDGLTDATFADQDLCYSNNVAYYNSEDHRMTFDPTTKKFPQGDMVFYHALTKVTVNMTAGDGFDAADSKKAFVNPATATLHGFYTKGDFELTGGDVSNQSEVKDVTTFMTNDDKSGTAEVVTRSAIIMPGRTLDATDKILTVSADGSTYDVTAAQLVAAMPADSKVMLQGTEYVINVRINKTGIKVAAYVKDWDKVEGEEVAPKIAVDTSWGTTGGTAKSDDFSLYLSESVANGYGTGTSPFAANSVVSKSGDKWTMLPQLYWDNHTVGYYFRGVWPQTGSEEGNPKVVTNSSGNQVINIQNVAYSQGTNPSDLMIGIPTKSDGSFEGAIGATEGTVNLTFKYVMSKVEVNLSTTDDNSKVPLTDATVEILNGKTAGEVLMKDRSVVTTGDASSWLLHATSTTNQFLDAIVPQSLDGLQFKITIKNSDESTDVYYATISEVKVKKNGESEYSAITSWESGIHYVYNLKVSKTKINISATLTEWTSANASQEIWF